MCIFIACSCVCMLYLIVYCVAGFAWFCGVELYIGVVLLSLGS